MDTQAFPWGMANMGQSSHVSVHGEQADNHLTSSYSLVETPYDQPAPPSNRIIQIPQVRYVHPSKKGRTRYGRPIDLEPIIFCLGGSGEEGILASDAFDGFRQSTLHLEGADDVVFRADHARNITMHILVRISFFSALSIPVCPSEDSDARCTLFFSMIISGPNAHHGKL